MNIYKINHFASSITVFIPLIFSPRTSVNNCFILLLLTAQSAFASEILTPAVHIPHHLTHQFRRVLFRSRLKAHLLPNS